VTSISEAFEVPAKQPSKVAAAAQRAGGAAVASQVRYAAGAVAHDVRSAWPWHGSPPTLADLWAARIPDLETVPGQNRALWAAWVAYNHVALLLTAPFYLVLWIVQHPAYLLLAALVTAPLIALWIFG
jgi:hypothetical protein